MKLSFPFASAAMTCLLAFGIAACERSDAHSCSRPEDLARKLAVITDDLSKATFDGRLSISQSGEIGALLVEAGTKFGANRDSQVYCTTLDGLHGRIPQK